MTLGVIAGSQSVYRDVLDCLRNNIDTALTLYRDEIELGNLPESIPARCFMFGLEQLPPQGNDFFRILIERVARTPLASVGESRDVYKITIYIATRSQVKKYIPSGASSVQEPDKTLQTSATFRAMSLAEVAGYVLEKYGVGSITNCYSVDVGTISHNRPKESECFGAKVEVTIYCRAFNSYAEQS